MNYQHKYLKYKYKYLNLKGGGCLEDITNDKNKLINQKKLLECAKNTPEILSNPIFKKLTYATNDEQTNKKFIIDILNNNKEDHYADPIIKYIDAPLLINNRDIVKLAISKNCKSLWFIGETLKNDEEFMLSILNNFYNVNFYLTYLRKLNKQFLNKDFLYKAIQLNYNLLNEIRILHIDIFRDMINNKPEIFRYLDSKSANKQDTLLDILRIEPNIFQFLNETLKIDKGFILKTLRMNPTIFQFLNEKLKIDKDFILKALEIDMTIFQFLNDKLKIDKDFLLKAINIKPEIIKYLDDKILVLHLLNLLQNENEKKNIVQYLDNQQLVLHLLQNKSEIFSYLNKKLKNSESFLLEALKIDGYFLLDSDIESTIKNNNIYIDIAYQTLKKNSVKEIKKEFKELYNSNIGFFRWSI